MCTGTERPHFGRWRSWLILVFSPLQLQTGHFLSPVRTRRTKKKIKWNPLNRLWLYSSLYRIRKKKNVNENDVKTVGDSSQFVRVCGVPRVPRNYAFLLRSDNEISIKQNYYRNEDKVHERLAKNWISN